MIMKATMAALRDEMNVIKVYILIHDDVMVYLYAESTYSLRVYTHF